MVNITKTAGETPKTASVLPLGSSAAQPFATLRDDVERLFDAFLMTPFTRRMMDFEPFRRMSLTPRVDVKESDQIYEITAELPGLDENDVEVKVADGVLTVMGAKKENHEETKGDYHLTERSYGSFRRDFALPETVDEEGIQAAFDKGVLTITLPKTETKAREARKIEVKASKH